MIYPQTRDFSFSTESKELDPTIPLNMKPLLPLEEFKKEFKYNPKLQQATDIYLKREWSHYIPIRGDGNCAY